MGTEGVPEFWSVYIKHAEKDLKEKFGSRDILHISRDHRPGGDIMHSNISMKFDDGAGPDSIGRLNYSQIDIKGRSELRQLNLDRTRDGGYDSPDFYTMKQEQALILSKLIKGITEGMETCSFENTGEKTEQQLLEENLKRLEGRQIDWKESIKKSRMEMNELFEKWKSLSDTFIPNLEKRQKEEAEAVEILKKEIERLGKPQQ